MSIMPANILRSILKACIVPNRKEPICSSSIGTEWCAAHGKTIEAVEQAAWNVGVAVQDGRMFHGPCHLRMNLALPLSRVQEAMKRLDQYVFNA